MAYRGLPEVISRVPPPSLKEGPVEVRLHNLEAWLNQPQNADRELTNVVTADLGRPGQPGTIVFNIEDAAVYVYTGTEWKALSWIP